MIDYFPLEPSFVTKRRYCVDGGTFSMGAWITFPVQELGAGWWTPDGGRDRRAQDSTASRGDLAGVQVRRDKGPAGGLISVPALHVVPPRLGRFRCSVPLGPKQICQ